MYNKVILIGNLTRDVELRYTPASGTAVAKFGLATNRTYKDSSTGENKQEVMFIDITVFGKNAEIANQYLAKGKRVLIEGRLVFEQWVDQNGQKRSKHSVIAERIQFMDLKSPQEKEDEKTHSQEAKPEEKPETNAQYEQPEVNINDEDIPF